MICALCAAPRMGAKGYIAALPPLIQRDAKSWSYRVYVTDTLRTLLENTAVPASALSDGTAGKLLETRWADLWTDKTKSGPAEKEQSAQEVIDKIKGKLNALSPA